MFISRIALLLLLAVAPFSYAMSPAEPEVSETELALAMEQLNAFLQLAHDIGGFYILSIVEPSVRAQKEAVKLLQNASNHELCTDLFGMPEPHTIVFGTPQGKVEAEKLKAALEALGCTVELTDLVA